MEHDKDNQPECVFGRIIHIDDHKGIIASTPSELLDYLHTNEQDMQTVSLHSMTYNMLLRSNNVDHNVVKVDYKRTDALHRRARPVTAGYIDRTVGCMDDYDPYEGDHDWDPVPDDLDGDFLDD